MKRKELFWMLIPCLLLIGFAIYLSRREVKPGKFAVTIETMQIVPATPRDVARGYDTVVLTKVKMTGPRSLDFFDTRQHFFDFSFKPEVVDAKGHVVNSGDLTGNRTADCAPAYYKEQVTILLKLASVPKSAGALYYRMRVGGVVIGQKPSRLLHQDYAPTQKLLVRGAGKVIKTPAVKKYRPFKVIGYEVMPQPARLAGTAECRLTIYVELFESLQRTEGRAGQTAIDNARIIADGKTRKDDGLHGYQTESHPAEISKTLTFPATCRMAIFKAHLSINECRPLPVEVVLRKNGKTLMLSKPKFTPIGL